MKRSRQLIVPVILSVTMIGVGVVVGCGESTTTSPPDAVHALVDAPVRDAPAPDAGVDAPPDAAPPGDMVATDASTIDAMPDAPA